MEPMESLIYSLKINHAVAPFFHLYEKVHDFFHIYTSVISIA
jgi:ubiquinone biosynthesis protein Coq4